MAAAVAGWKAFRIYLEMIKFEHSIFALPFAMIGTMWGAARHLETPWPGGWAFGWIIAAMVSARSAAMAYNRILDRQIDAENPRTKMRAIPAGLLSMRQASLFFWGSVVLFFVSAAMLNPLALALSPIAIGTTLFYSATKRFTPLCHFVLGLSLGIAPAAAWVGSTGRLDWAIVPLVAAVLLWTGGFDIIYSLQDEEFDREQGLRSLPQTLGKARALAVSRACHTVSIALLAWSCWLNQGGVFAYAGVAFAAALLIYEQSLVKPHDLSRVNLAFFTLNGFVSVGFFAFVLLDQLWRIPVGGGA